MAAATSFATLAIARPAAAPRQRVLLASPLLSLCGGRVPCPSVSVSGGSHGRTRFVVTSASAEPKFSPTRFQISTSDGQHTTSEYYLDGPGSWILYHVGDFVISSSDELTKLKFSTLQIDCTHTKGGLCVDSVYIYPKDHRPECTICK